MRTSWLIAGTAGLLAGCGQSGDNAAANQAVANAAQPKKKPAFCFFKDEEMKSLTAARGKDGNITLKGTAHVKDSRYKAVLGVAEVTGATANIAPTIVINDTGFGAPQDWWAITATLPGSAAVTRVAVRCGAKTVAELDVAPKR